MYRHYGKRLLDLILTVLALVVLSPVLAVIALMVLLRLGTPVLFRQQRPGPGGQPFTLYKFRTMTDACDPTGQLLPDAQRLTKFGRSLRATSLDELPELFNVLKGEMSLVGSRPLRVEHLPLYTTHQARRHETQPGITGWAQINGRNALSWEERFDLDVWYVDHTSLWLDIKIMILTIRSVIRREGIHAAGQATMYRFIGTTPAQLSESISE
jgi:sugar transferase EpsL